MKVYHYFTLHSELSAVLTRPELVDKKILSISLAYVFNDHGEQVGERIDVLTDINPAGIQSIEPTQEDRLEAAELMIDLLLDTQQESA